MIQSREIAKNLGLQMKIGDVEYQGDGNKAIFYYIADERVDFRQLIKVLADTFHVRIEMKQIGARQEAGRIGGTGPCGRELCCATWMKNFVSVSTNAARIQDISLNPQKLAGMCAKLKCCLNYEVDDYVEAGRKMPARDVVLETLDSDYYLFKSDILAGLVTYSTGKGVAANLVTITAERARAIIEMNKRGEKPESLAEDGKQREGNQHSDLLADADLSRFDKSKKNKKKKNKKPRQPANEAARPANENAQQPTAEGNAQPKAENAQQSKGDNAQPKAENGQQPKGENGQQPRRDNNRNNRNNNRQRPRPEGQRRNNNGPRGENRQPRNNAEAKPSAPQQPKQQPAPQQPKQQNTTGNEG